MEFITAVDIGNRALQHCGAEMMDAALGFTENSKAARQVSFVYGKLRRAELRRRTWIFATKTAALRPVDTDTMLLAPALWSSSTTYFVGSIVLDENNNFWISNIPDNLANDPQNSTTWESYFGPLTVSLYDSTTTYYSGELVYTAEGDGTNRVFLSRQSANEDNPATATTWDATTVYFKNQVVTYLSVAYMSLIDLNTNQAPNISGAAWATVFVGGTGSLKWLQIGGAEFPMGVTLTTLNIVYPLGTGPDSQSTTRNVYRLPAGYLRTAPQDPRAGSTSSLGAPSGLAYSDWRYDGSFITTPQAGVILFRFIADVIDVTKMDDMFCEGVAARIAMAVCEPLTQSNTKLGSIASEYKKFMDEAGIVNAIEVGAVEPALDDYLACRA